MFAGYKLTCHEVQPVAIVLFLFCLTVDLGSGVHLHRVITSKSAK